MLRSVIIFSLIFISLNTFAQKDTTNPQSVVIVSSYRPVLGEAVKINFSGTQLNADTFRNVAPYKIPSQHLFYAYQPVPLQPLNLEKDQSLQLGQRYFVKAGFGNLSTAFLNAGASFGDGTSSLINVYGDYSGSTGKVKNQDYSVMNLIGKGSYFGEKHEIYAGLGISSKSYKLYGYDHNLYDFEKKDVRQLFQEIDFKGGVKTTHANSYGITYDPTLNVNFFTLANKLNETSIIINAPAEKIISSEIVAKLEANIDFTRYATNSLVKDTNFNNTIVRLSPAVKFFGPALLINAGISPVWDNGDLNIIPDVYIEAKIQDQLKLQAGWVGKIYKNTVRELSKTNPFLEPPHSKFNTKEIEFYGGLKATLGNHFNFSGKASWLTYDHFALFLNDTASVTNNFKVMDEERMNNFRIQGSISYVQTENFNITGGFTLNAYTGMKTFSKAWNTVPLEITGSATWFPIKKLMVKGDVYIFGGGKYFDKEDKTLNLKGGTDLSLSAEYKINNQFSAWIQGNNLLNDKYERWSNYPVYGINLLAGILIKF